MNNIVFGKGQKVKRKISHSLRSSSHNKFLKLKKLIRKIPHSYSFLFLEWMAFNQRKSLAPIL